MSDETTRYVQTDQDLRSTALYTAERLVTEQIRAGAFSGDPVAKTLEYADTIFKYVKEGQING